MACLPAPLACFMFRAAFTSRCQKSGLSGLGAPNCLSVHLRALVGERSGVSRCTQLLVRSLECSGRCTAQTVHPMTRRFTQGLWSVNGAEGLGA